MDLVLVERCTNKLTANPIHGWLVACSSTGMGFSACCGSIGDHNVMGR